MFNILLLNFSHNLRHRASKMDSIGKIWFMGACLLWSLVYDHFARRCRLLVVQLYEVQRRQSAYGDVTRFLPLSSKDAAHGDFKYVVFMSRAC